MSRIGSDKQNTVDSRHEMKQEKMALWWNTKVPVQGRAEERGRTLAVRQAKVDERREMRGG